MAKKDEIVSRLSQLLAEQISLSDFSKWFLPYAWDIEEGDEAFDLAEAIDAELVQFDIDTPELRARLQQLHASYDQISVNVLEICLAEDGANIFAQPIIRSQGNPAAEVLEVALTPQRDELLMEFVNALRRSRSLQSTLGQ